MRPLSIVPSAFVLWVESGVGGCLWPTRNRPGLRGSQEGPQVAGLEPHSSETAEVVAVKGSTDDS